MGEKDAKGCLTGRTEPGKRGTPKVSKLGRKKPAHLVIAGAAFWIKGEMEENNDMRNLLLSRGRNSPSTEPGAEEEREGEGEILHHGTRLTRKGEDSGKAMRGGGKITRTGYQGEIKKKKGGRKE